ncbi:MAG TPA: hypothetical protein VMH38_09900 [Thermoplasmata archaeon]|nr:hypothetical protein [Thermoplasmata archaeon]
MGAAAGYPMQQPMMAAEPPEVESIKSMLHVARIIALIFGIILLVFGIITLIFIIGIVPLIFGIVDLVMYSRFKEIEAMVNQRQYEAAKAKTLVWMIIGFILGGILVGIFALIAYLKFDPVISWQRNQMQGGAPPVAFMPPAAAPATAAPATAAPPAGAPAAAPSGAPPFCIKCGKPTTFIPQYGRYYCYTDNLYV